MIFDLFMLLFLELWPQNISELEMAPVEISVPLSSVEGITRGSPVLLEGGIAGEVVAIDYRTAAKENLKYTVKIGIAPEEAEKLSEDTIVLVKTPLIKKGIAQNTVLELLTFGSDSEELKANELQGYASFEEYWRTQ